MHMSPPSPTMKLKEFWRRVRTGGGGGGGRGGGGSGGGGETGALEDGGQHGVKDGPYAGRVDGAGDVHKEVLLVTCPPLKLMLHVLGRFRAVPTHTWNDSNDNDAHLTTIMIMMHT